MIFWHSAVGDSTAKLFADDAVLKQNAHSSKEKFEKAIESVDDDYFDKISAKLSKRSGLFCKLRSILSNAQLLVTYKVCVQPILNYYVLVNGTSSKTTF